MLYKLNGERFEAEAPAASRINTQPCDECEQILDGYHTSRQYLASPICTTIDGDTTVGIELELEFSEVQQNKAIPQIETVFANAGISDDKFHIERDGSLDNGFEVVMSYGHLNGYKTLMEKILADNIFEQVEFIKAGLHINVGIPRDAYLMDFNFHALATMLVCDNGGNSDRVDAIMGHIGMRTNNNQYCPLVNMSDLKIAYMTQNLPFFTGARRAYNTRGRNRDVIEWRLFAATVDIDEMKLRLEMADCMGNFCHQFAPHSGIVYGAEGEPINILEYPPDGHLRELREQAETINNNALFDGDSHAFKLWLTNADRETVWKELVKFAKDNAGRYPNLLNVQQFVNLV